MNIFMQQDHQCRNNSLVLLTSAPIGAWKCNFSLFERDTKQPLTYQQTDGHEGSWESYNSNNLIRNSHNVMHLCTCTVHIREQYKRNNIIN